VIGAEHHCGFSWLGSLSHFLKAWCRDVTAQEAAASLAGLHVPLEVGLPEVRARPSC